MDRRDGRIYEEEKMRKLFHEQIINKHFMPIDPTKAQLARRPPRVGRNDPCPCGSGLKFKKCCLQGKR